MAKKNSFTTHEVATMRKYWPTPMPIAEILTMLPRHTYDSLKHYARETLKLSRPNSWDRIRLMLMMKPRTKAEIAAELGITIKSASTMIEIHRAEVFVKSWDVLTGSGRRPARFALGNEPDAPIPTPIRFQAKRRVNPFLAAAGLVQAPTTEATGRVYKQAMEVEDQMEEA